ncbi:sensor histidine kinase [Pedosphaera parvula]|uniref:histidine kinase n=1 Tax=Pedosphaera parvula (strain Ellin514) TaxID=320771 RepID=B9XSQ3_PEDPL|nr:sensor histidine kinase KdpD [Pedosphaera parvula]EEF57138.1 osmosensitive K+ channel signal transduction histidine kinase [Pedosphaera parvula Ellin514]
MTDDLRADPDQLLEAIQKQESLQKRGRLKVFLGMAAGVGKTYAMLEAAIKQKSLGVDVVIGYVETHGRMETDLLAQKLPTIPRKQIEHRGILLPEMDVDAVLARKPRVALVDELAHTNAPGARHPKRYQDVLELLDAGIDVYTTLNVQHVESRAHTVEDITGSTIHETVPDSILDLAEIELIDISPEDLMRRLDEGKVYMPDRAAVAMVNFFREGNLTALREIALRLAADRVGQDVRDYMQVMQIPGPWKTGHRLLVAISASPLSAQMVRWTRRLADSLDAPWFAVHVETSRVLPETDQTRLNKNLAIARELGAEVITTADEDVIRGLLRIARQHNATQIVVGKPAGHNFISWFKGGHFLRRLVEESGDIDIHVVRADKAETPQTPFTWKPQGPIPWKQYGWSLGLVAAVTVLNSSLDSFIGHRAVALIYLLSVVILALFVGRGPVVMTATLSALLWNFFFLPPRFTLYITTIEDAMMFGMYFIVAIVMGELIARFRAKEKAERKREERTTALYHLTRELADAISLDQIVAVLVRHIGKLFNAEAAVLLSEPGNELPRQPMSGSTLKISEKEHSVATWVLHHNQKAGQFTDNLPLSEALYLPLSTATGALGVVGVRLPQSSAPSLEQTNLLEAFVRQAALVIDRQRLHESFQQTRLVAESERLSKTLLDSISHEMRTPLAAITSATSALGDPSHPASPAYTQAMLNEVREAVTRLNRLVGNLLDIARVETGHVKPRLDWCDVGDLINVTVNHLQKELSGRPLNITIHPQVPLVRMDFVLMEQALTNLLLNAAFHTPAGTAIDILAEPRDKELALTVADHGHGIPPESLPRLFDKFYRTPGTSTGGTGLGLSIVKGFMEAQNGRVQVENRPAGGAAFTLYLPLSEVPNVAAETS